MGAFFSWFGIPVVDCSQNGTIDWTTGSLTSELAQYPIFTLLFAYASVATVVIVVIFFEAAFFTATRVPRSSVANHRINTVIMISVLPVFVVCSLPAILIPTAAEFCIAVLDLYFAFVMFKFIVLQVDYYGGHRKMMARLAAERIMFQINVPLLCCFCCLKPARLTRKSFTVIKILVLQVAIIRPILTFFQAIISFTEAQLYGIHNIVILLISVPSTLTGVTGMNMLTQATIRCKDLVKFYIDKKALLMTATLLINGFQPTLIMIGTWFRPLGCVIPFPTTMMASQWQAFLLILESTLLMIPILRYYRTGDGNVVGVPPPIEDYDEEPTTNMGKMRQWIRRHTLM